jgi:hypothetical protein
VVDRELAKRIVDYLNELVSLDNKAIEDLVNTRVPCNQALVNHPTCQVAVTNEQGRVGLLGLLNGLVGVFDDGPKKGWGGIAARFTRCDENDNGAGLQRFSVVEEEDSYNLVLGAKENKP